MIFIYLDVYFLINLALDYIALFTATSLFRYKVSFSRLFSSAVITSIFSLVFLFVKGGTLFLIPTALLASTIAVGVWDFKVFLTFVFSELFLGGMGEALNSLFEKKLSGTVRGLLVLTVLIIVLPIYLILQKKARRCVESECVRARLCAGDKTIELRLLVDSGNLVFEPCTGRRVIFVGSKISKNILEALSPDTEWHEVSVRTASGQSVLRAFIPENLFFEKDTYNKENFLILPSNVCRDFAGFDGIVPLIK